VQAAAAEATGLAAGTPVIAGMIDIDASAIGAGVVRPGPASVVVGSWSINQAVSEQLPDDADLFLQSIFADPHYWLLCEASATSASNLEWFIAQFCGDDRRAADAEGVSVYEIIGRAVDGISPRECDVIYQPFLYGAPVHPHARAGFYNLTGWHTRAHLLRALYEGIVFGHRYHLDRLRAAGVAVAVVRLAGGAARSAVWSQMFADILELPVEVTASSETGALGVALAAGVGVGLFPDLPAAVERAVHVTRTYAPDPTYRADYQQRYATYTRLLDAMRGEWDALGRHETHAQDEDRL
jgi:L-xylulokinase